MTFHPAAKTDRMSPHPDSSAIATRRLNWTDKTDKIVNGLIAAAAIALLTAAALYW